MKISEKKREGDENKEEKQENWQTVDLILASLTLTLGQFSIVGWKRPDLPVMKTTKACFVAARQIAIITHCLGQKTHQVWNGIAQNNIIRIDFDDIWQKYSKYSRMEFVCFSFHVGLFILSTFRLSNRISKISRILNFYSGVFWIFQLNFIKIDRRNFELYCFKVGAFFETQCRSANLRTTFH